MNGCERWTRRFIYENENVLLLWLQDYLIIFETHLLQYAVVDGVGPPQAPLTPAGWRSHSEHELGLVPLTGG